VEPFSSGLPLIHEAASGLESFPFSVLPIITGAGGALVVLAIGLYLFISGKLMPTGMHKEIVSDKEKQIELLSAAYERERARADSAVLAAQTTRDVLQALHATASLPRGGP
jgi:hypothetical protein